MRRIVVYSALSLIVLVSAAPALAQGPSRRPYRALFGSGYADATQMLRASATAGTGYATEVGEEARGGFGGRAFRRARTYFSGALSYAFQRNDISLSATTSGRYSPSSPRPFMTSSAASALIRRSLAQRISASASASVTYRPYGYGSVFPGLGSADEDIAGAEGTGGRGLLVGDVDAAELASPLAEDDDREIDWDLAANSSAYVMYRAGARISHRLGNRTSYGVHYGFRMMPERGRAPEFVRQAVGADMHHALGRGLTVRGGYTYGESHRGDNPTRDHHTIDGGLNYGRSLSISRRTSLSFASGSFARKTGDNMNFRLTGNATLTHELARSWTVAGSIRRGVLVYEAYDEPVVRDGLSVRVRGLLTRRVNLSAMASTGLGSIGLEEGAPAFSAVHAAVSVGIAVNQITRASVVYGYYMHRFDQGTVMPDDSPLTLDRHSVRALVSVGVPLFYRIGRSDASR